VTIDLKDFKGEAKRLDNLDIPVMAARMSMPEDLVHALDEVESAGSGFDKHGRPAMLFEPHLFYRNLSGAARDKAVRAGLAYRDWKRDYPADSYPRLLRAMEIDEDAALKSASWGRYQTLGSHHRALGYRTPQAMVEAFMDDEETHLEAFVTFVIVNRLDDDLREGRYDVFFSGYNGPLYKQHGYDRKFQTALRKWRTIPDTPVPDEKPAYVDGATVKAVQKKLYNLGYVEVGMADGSWGPKTRGTILAFRADNNLPLVPLIDDELMAALVRASPRPVSEARATATAAELRDKGSRTLAAADRSRDAGVVVAAGGAGVGLIEQLDSWNGVADQATGLLGKLEPYLDSVRDYLPWLLAALGAYIALKQLGIVNFRVQDYREGKSLTEGKNAQ
jgi:hypothetical protein